jgi:ABC-2 type transport system permease protein
MSNSTTSSAPTGPKERAPSVEQTLRRLFLTLFLRGRSSRGLKKQSAPKSIGQKLSLTLVFYALFGLLALSFLRQSVFALAVYLHAMTFVFLGMFVASSAGEVLFNDQEADILLHRPISSRALLWAKVRVLVEVSLWLAGAFNLTGLFVGLAASNGDWRFPFVHAASTVLEALCCTGCVVMVYQFCLRWFGRERLDGLMTMAQVVISVAAVLSGQLLPQLLFRVNTLVNFNEKTWWIALLPPAWFAGLDDALAGSAARGSWLLGAFAIVSTGVVLWVAFGKLAHDYGAGLQRLGELAPTRSPRAGHRRWIDVLIDMPPLRWWLRDSVARASFLLTAAYLVRDRDVKLRVYPAIASYMVMPVILLAQGHGSGPLGIGGFGIAFSGAFLGMIPMLALSLLQYSQQWQASDIFRAAPMPGPASLCHGARQAIVCFLAMPTIGISALVVWVLSHRQGLPLLLLLPGIVAMPVYALIPSLGGKAVPLSLPNEEAKSASRGLHMIGAIFISLALSGLAVWSWSTGWFSWFLLTESILAIGLYAVLRRSLDNVRWPSLE